MGKVADNERLRLKANFFNNLAVGTALTAVVVPFIGLFRILADHQNEVVRITNLNATWVELKQPILIVLALVVTAVAGNYYASEFRKVADSFASRLKG